VDQRLRRRRRAREPRAARRVEEVSGMMEMEPFP
jgi:hypothetical protein